MIKLDKKDYKNVQNLINNLEVNCTFGYGVILNDMPGRVFVDDTSNPQSCFIACDGGKYMVAGNEENDKFNSELVDFLMTDQNHKIYYDFYATSDKWIELLSKGLEGHSIPLARTIYTYKASKTPTPMPTPIYNDFNKVLEEGYELKKMDENLFNELVTKVDSTSLDQWGCAEIFVSKGIGYCIVHEGKIACICYSVVTGGGYAELSIYTIKQYRNKGFALIACSAFVQECIKKNLITIWDAGSDNEPSNKLALKLGFSKAKECELIFWHENHDVIQGYLDGKNFM